MNSPLNYFAVYSTAHGYCGSTLEDAKGDLLEWYRPPSMEAMLRAYIIRSRIRLTERFLLIQPYSPMLFAQGTLPGPSLLLKAQKQELDEDQLREAWANVANKEAEQKKLHANFFTPVQSHKHPFYPEPRRTISTDLV